MCPLILGRNQPQTTIPEEEGDRRKVGERDEEKMGKLSPSQDAVGRLLAGMDTLAYVVCVEP